MAYIRQDQADIRLIVDGVSYDNGDSWFSYSGGTLSSAGAKTRAGGMGREVELGGPATRSDVTLTTQNNPIIASKHKALEARCGRAEALIPLQYLDAEGRVIPGARFTARGILKEVDLPDSTSDAPAAGMYTAVVACHELMA